MRYLYKNILLFLFIYDALGCGVNVVAANDVPSSGAEMSCVNISGVFKNEGEDGPKNNRGSTASARFSFDVLQRGGPRVVIDHVRVETTNEKFIGFKFINPLGDIVESHSFETTCENGWKTIFFSTSGGSEGFSGTQSTKVQLMISDDQSLRVKVARDLKGRDFYIFPRHEQTQFEYRFPRSK